MTRDQGEFTARALRLVTGFFSGDLATARLWMATPNPQLGGISPNDMIGLGRGKKLLAFIETSLAENQWS